MFVDIFKVATTNVADTNVINGNVLYIPNLSSPTSNTTGIRIGMSLTTTGGYEKKDEVKVFGYIKCIYRMTGGKSLPKPGK